MAHIYQPAVGGGYPGGGERGIACGSVENRYGANRGFIAFRNQTGDSSVAFRTDYFLDKKPAGG